ncbi:MAG: hypothetical protein HPY65_00755 [Syntrophaceae bacterium]|nr:hypothetical protein [Syntrophaceae bacterium]
MPKISQLPAATTAADADITLLVQGGSTKKVALSVLKAYFNGSKEWPIQVVEQASACSQYAAADNGYIPDSMNGMNLVGAVAGASDPGIGGTMEVAIYRNRETRLGDSTTQFDITNPSGTTFRYTYDGTGTDPGIADSLASLQIGDQVIPQAQNFAAGNNGKYVLTGVGANYFEIDNAGGAVESNKTLGTGYLAVNRTRSMLSTNLNIDSYHTTSVTAAVPAAVDMDFDDIRAGDRIVSVIMAIHSGTPATGLGVTPTFRLP